MAYPIRWDEIAAPRENDGTVCGNTEQTASLRAYFHRLTAATIAGAAIVCLIVMAVSASFLNQQQGPALRFDSTASTHPLTAVTPKALRRLGFVTVTGTVVNRSAVSQTGVEVVVELLDGAGHVLSSQSAMVDRNRIGSGEDFDLPDRNGGRAVRNLLSTEFQGAPIGRTSVVFQLLSGRSFQSLTKRVVGLV